MKMPLVYMDNNATTPIHPEVKKELIEKMDLYGNPSSMHEFGRTARKEVERARELISGFIGAESDEVVFTGGGSESNNTVLKYVSCGDPACTMCPASRREIITSSIEHPSVLNTAEVISKGAIAVRYIGVDKYGKLNIEELKERISEKTALVSIMMANNEIGTIQNIKKISQIAHRYGCLVHTDAVQALGKIPVNVQELDIDFMSFSGHKIYGPKGIGALYIKKGSPFCVFIHGGHQEAGRRAGTLNTLGIIGFGKAVELAGREMDEDARRIYRLRKKLETGILERIPDALVNGHPDDCLPGTLNISFMGAEGESILLYLDLEGIAVSTGSACATGSLDPSHVLIATGLGAETAHGSIRFSIGRDNSDQDVEYVLDKLPPIIERIRKMSTVYVAGGKK